MTPLDTAFAMMDTNEASNTPEANGENVTTISTRFGTFEVNLDKAIEMPQGPLGFVDLQRFALLDLPEAEDSPLKLFQSLEDTSVTFIVNVVSSDTDWIAEADLEAACQGYSIQPENAAYLIITKVQRTLDGSAQTTLNLRAPIVVDIVHQVARQAVFSGEKYSMQHVVA